MTRTRKEKLHCKKMVKLNVGRLLRGLGKTRAQVAATLRRAGVKGRRLHPLFCPVANWLNEQFTGKSVKFEVGPCEIWVLKHTGRHFVGYADITTPDPVSDFIKAFDDGRFAKDLLAEDWR